LPFIAKALGIHPQLAWEHRHEHRDFWYNFCNELRKDDPCFLIRRVLAEGDMVVGIRDIVELEGLKREKLVDAIIWVDANGRVDYVDPTVTFTIIDCDYLLPNWGSKEDLKVECRGLCEQLQIPLRAPVQPKGLDL
jgi:hypothetical protein